MEANQQAKIIEEDLGDCPWCGEKIEFDILDTYVQCSECIYENDLETYLKEKDFPKYEMKHLQFSLNL